MLQSYLSFPLVGNQIEISLFQPQHFFDGTLDSMMKHRAGIMAWSPLGGGKFLAGENESSRRVLDGIHESCSKAPATASQLLLAWLLRHPGNIFPVMTATKPERIIESVRALDIKLDRQDWFEC
ncbi:MAG: aldo/keto reductase [Verrucomicrobiota bacterium]